MLYQSTHKTISRYGVACMPCIVLTISVLGGFPGCSDDCFTGTGKQVGQISDAQLEEASALAASQASPDVFWTLDDSGNPADVFAIHLDGSLVARYAVPDATNVDWEDLAVGPCSSACACLFIADIGDNDEARTTYTVYRVPEPSVSSTVPDGGSTAKPDVLTFSYPDGSHNAETLLVDPRNGDLFIVTKEDDGNSRVFKFPSPEPASSPIVLEQVATISFTGCSSSSLRATGGSVASDGSRFVIRTYDHALEYVIPTGEPLEKAFSSAPHTIPLLEAAQGEGISYSPDGLSLYTSSEQVPSPIQEVSSSITTPVTTPIAALAGLCEQ